VNEEANGCLSTGAAHEQVTCLLCHPASIRVAGARDELDAAALKWDEKEDVDASEPDGLDGKEVAGEHRLRLLAKELPPARPVSLRRRRQPLADQDRADGTRSDRNTEREHLTDDPPVAPRGVLAREAEDEPLHLAIDRWPPQPPTRVRPAACHKALVPAQQRPRADREDVPGVSGQWATQRRQQKPVRLAQPRALPWAAQDRDLLPEHQDLQLLRARRARHEHHQLEQTADTEHARDHSTRDLERTGNGPTLPSPYRTIPSGVTEFLNPTRL